MGGVGTGLEILGFPPIPSETPTYNLFFRRYSKDENASRGPGSVRRPPCTGIVSILG
jgi:hypothetical protein